MRILGIDPGLTRCGVGVVDLNSNRRASFVGVHVVRTPSTNELPLRLLELETGLGELFELYQPDAVAIERVFSQHNVRTAMGTAQASAVAMLLAARNHLEAAMYTPTEVKAAVTGSGRANKVQVAEMVKRLLSLKEIPKPVDSTDALALAICHIWRGTGNTKLESAVAAEKLRLAKLVGK